MPLPVNLETARASYHSFVTGLLASQAYIGLYKPPVTNIVDVPREEALTRFLTEHPEFRPFRDELSGMFEELKIMPLDAERWTPRSRA